MLAFLSGLTGTGATLTLLIVQVLGAYPTATMAPKIDEFFRTDVLICLVMGPFMTGTKHKLLTKFLKLKPPAF